MDWKLIAIIIEKILCRADERTKKNNKKNSVRLRLIVLFYTLEYFVVGLLNDSRWSGLRITWLVLLGYEIHSMLKLKYCGIQI